MKKSSFISLLDCNSLSFHLFFCLHVALCFSQFYHPICFKLCSILKSTAAFCTAVCSKKHFICYTQIFICTEINSFVLKSLSLSVFMIFFPLFVFVTSFVFYSPFFVFITQNPHSLPPASSHVFCPFVTETINNSPYSVSMTSLKIHI